MLLLRQQTRALVRLSALAALPAGPTALPVAPAALPGAAASLASSPAWLLAAARAKWGVPGFRNKESGDSGGGGGITGWLTDKLVKGASGKELEDLDLETFHTSLKRARQLGGLTGFVHGTGAIADGGAQGTLRLFEQIIDGMRPEEKRDLQLFDAAARQRVADEVGATVQQVDDCMARFLWTQQMTRKVAALRKEGKEMPRSVDELERMLGTWRQYKTEHESGSAAVPPGHVGFKGQPCPLAGAPVAKNTRCPATKKAFKACCGKTMRI
ncbi:SEC-C motif [Micractinium conductrix]|uniref:SEC-C motif n=1 Tax=Micractinium conductrix TaxID=554055 RepID=A0A2P6VQ74_9CHLO|nr:SEC-C motif [Micractinium conductrix]|eukprot:PSC76217.1 SEC-C motif [Micractinium conductrix]